MINQDKTFQGICINPKQIENLISSPGDSPEGRQPEVPEPAKVTNTTSMYNCILQKPTPPTVVTNTNTTDKDNDKGIDEDVQGVPKK